MIHSVQITDPKRCCVPWWGAVPWLQDKTEIEFKPGLNVIYGPNGSGKSTLLKLLARTLCCSQGGEQYVTREAVLGHEGLQTYGRAWDGVVPIHDGAPVMHFDPGRAVGLIGGLAGFDHDFFDEGVSNTMMRASDGQTNLQRMVKFLDAAFKGKWSKLRWQLKQENYPELAAFLGGNLPEGVDSTDIPTILLDEPTRSLELRAEIALMRRLAEIKDVQVIMATHSTFALHLPGANFIDTSKDYSDLCRIDTELAVLNGMARNLKMFEVTVNHVLDRLKKEDPK